MERDENLHKLLLKKEAPNHSEDLKIQIMDHIIKLNEKRSSNLLLLNLTWGFFIIGLITGIILAIQFKESELNLFDVNLSKYRYFFQASGIFILLLLFDRIYTLTRKIRKQIF